MRTQTIVIHSKLALLIDQRPVCDIPNKEGFPLLGVLPSGLSIPLKVCRDANGCHYLADQFNTHRLPSAFTGWLPDNAKR